MKPPNFCCDKKTSLYIELVSNLNFKVWEHNRMIDLKRVDAIVNMYRAEERKTIPGTIYAFRDNCNNAVIIDGNHRIHAKEKYNKDMRVILEVLETDDEEKIIDLYIKVNSASPVPELYMQLKNRKTKKICESIVKHYKEKYSEFFSPSSRPHKPNTNEDKFIEKLSEIVKEDSTVENIIKHLESINLKNKEIYQKKAILKCQKQDFYLFYSDKF